MRKFKFFSFKMSSGVDYAIEYAHRNKDLRIPVAHPSGRIDTSAVHRSGCVCTVFVGGCREVLLLQPLHKQRFAFETARFNGRQLSWTRWPFVRRKPQTWGRFGISFSFGFAWISWAHRPDLTVDIIMQKHKIKKFISVISKNYTLFTEFRQEL